MIALASLADLGQTLAVFTGAGAFLALIAYIADQDLQRIEKAEREQLKADRFEYQLHGRRS